MEFKYRPLVQRLSLVGSLLRRILHKHIFILMDNNGFHLNRMRSTYSERILDWIIFVRQKIPFGSHSQTHESCLLGFSLRSLTLLTRKLSSPMFLPRNPRIQSQTPFQEPLWNAHLSLIKQCLFDSNTYRCGWLSWVLNEFQA